MVDRPEAWEGQRITRRNLLTYVGIGSTLVAAAPPSSTASAHIAEDAVGAVPLRDDSVDRWWRAGDHHVHSEYSGDLDTSTNPPKFIKGADGVYPIVTNAIMARFFGLTWVMCTDHGGPTHSKVNLELAYPDLLRSRSLVPEVLQFWGMEFDTPAHDHHTLMIPRHDGEAEQLFEIESQFSKRDPFPTDPSRDTEAKMIEFLTAATGMSPRPLVIAHHPARSAPGPGVYGQNTPREFRRANHLAPDVYIGFEGAPGHQAGPLVGNPRGAYGNYPTHGGFDQMTARLGGLWDSLLSEGRRWWITATSDSHVHWTRGGVDFWPGEYSKTYVLARQDYADVMHALRNGRIFVTTGDLITGLDVVAHASGRRAGVGETLAVGQGRDVQVEISLRPLARANFNGDRPQLRRVDLIVGQITGPNPNPDADSSPTTKVVARFGPGDWQQRGAALIMRHPLRDVGTDTYLRVRGTNTDEAEPLPDADEDPWSDLWFYSNPVFIRPT